MNSASVESVTRLLTTEVWAGAVLGAAVSAAFAFFGTVLKRGYRLLPLQRLLGALARNDSECAVFVRGMFRDDNTFYSRVPEYLKSVKVIKVERWINIPEVFGSADVRAAADTFNLLGQAGRRERVEFYSLDEDWDLWSKDLVCIGGHFKTVRILELASRTLVGYQHPDRFVFPKGPTFIARDHDYGLILKMTHPETKKICLVLMGLGALGTEAAGHYLRENGAMIGRLYGSRDFALLLEVDLNHGKEAATLCWLNPQPRLVIKLLHPIAWFSRLRGVRRRLAGALR